MISNSIGVSVLDALPADTSSSHCTATSPSVPRGIDHLTYHWKTDKEGHPGPVLSVPPINNCRADQQRLWPIASLSVVASTEAGKTAVKLFLLADIVCLNGDAAEKLQFEDYETALLLVHNPFDAPQSWKFDFKVFPDLGKANVKWYGVDALTVNFSHAVLLPLPTSFYTAGSRLSVQVASLSRPASTTSTCWVRTAASATVWDTKCWAESPLMRCCSWTCRL